MDDAINLDVHAINELKTLRLLPPSTDAAKYCYSADSHGNYSASLSASAVLILLDDYLKHLYYNIASMVKNPLELSILVYAVISSLKKTTNVRTKS